MSLIKKNDYGVIAINKRVIQRMIVDELIAMSDKIILCNKKGKVIKTGPAAFMESYLDAVDIYEDRRSCRVKVFVITMLGNSASDIADEIISNIEAVYLMLCMNKPDRIDVCIKGIMYDQLVKRNIEVSRKNG